MDLMYVMQPHLDMHVQHSCIDKLQGQGEKSSKQMQPTECTEDAVLAVLKTIVNISQFAAGPFEGRGRRE